jgi:hypothetical protein
MRFAIIHREEKGTEKKRGVGCKKVDGRKTGLAVASSDVNLMA